jgi:hypothetical protein
LYAQNDRDAQDDAHHRGTFVASQQSSPGS